MISRNGKRIIGHFIHHAETTIPEIAAAMELSIGTATKEIIALQEDGYVQNNGKIATGSGRKPSSFSLNPNSYYYAGIDLNDKFINYAIMDLSGNLVSTGAPAEFKLENTPESLRRVCDFIRELRSRNTQEYGKIRYACVSLPGRVNSRTGCSHTYFDFTERPLSEIFSECLGRPVCISNDTRSMAYAEYLKGCANGEKNVIFINVNWGIGVGLILDGKPYFGKSGYSGEFGHIHAFENQIICRCGKMGCLETEMSGLALVRKLTDRIRKGHSSILSERVLKSEKPLTLEEILLALKQEDTLCIDVIEEIGGLLGIRVAGLINLFNPELVVIGGILSGAGDYLLQPLRMNIIKHSLALANQDTVIRTSTLGARTGIIGACLVARSYDFNLYC